MYRVREFYDDLETFHLFLLFVAASFLLITFMSVGILQSNLVATHTTPVRYRDESAVSEIDWDEAIQNFSFTVASE